MGREEVGDKLGFEGEREGDEDVINPKRERIALCARD